MASHIKDAYSEMRPQAEDTISNVMVMRVGLGLIALGESVSLVAQPRSGAYFSPKMRPLTRTIR